MIYIIVFSYRLGHEYTIRLKPKSYLCLNIISLNKSGHEF